MTIEIRRPELEALILERMQKGAFESVEDVLLQALKAFPLSSQEHSLPRSGLCAPTGTDLIAAMQASPYKEISIEPSRYQMPVRDVVF